MDKIMIIDDAKDFCEVLNRFLSRHGYAVEEIHHGKEALEQLKKDIPDLIICDFRLDDMTGAAFIKSIRDIQIDVPVVIVTGYGDIKTAVKVMKLGAVDYLTKPFIPEELLAIIRNALRSQNSSNTLNDKQVPELAVAEREEPQYIFGESSYFKNILKQIDLVAPTDYSVIIYGESGSGKEAIAQEIHKRSRRSDEPFIPIDCGVLTHELANSELFGHEKGSFTGAIQQKSGSFELANKGTIFLDEIANLPYDVQMMLLRVVQERKMRRVGGTQDIDLNVRIIVASNEKLWDSMGGGKIREDLFHRLNEFVIEVAPLRQRDEDLMTFAHHFLRIANRELRKNISGFSLEVEEIFRKYDWPGNLRELRNIVKRATLLAEDGTISIENIPYELTKVQNSDLQSAKLFEEPSFIQGTGSGNITRSLSLKDVGIDAEYELIMETLRKVNFNKSKAAKLLNIDRKTLYYKINQYFELKGKKPEK